MIDVLRCHITISGNSIQIINPQIAKLITKTTLMLLLIPSELISEAKTLQNTKKGSEKWLENSNNNTTAYLN